MQSLVQLPAPALRGVITHYAGFRGRVGGNGITQTALPSRHAHLIISLANPIEVVAMPDPRQRPGRFHMLVNGLQDGPAYVSGTAEIDMLHVFLKPPGVHALLGVPCAALGNCVVELSDLWGAAAAVLHERLLAARSWPQRFAVLNATLQQRFQPAGPRDELLWAWRQLAQARGMLPIAQVARDIGWSRRHFSEEFVAAFGLAPKAVARILRFEHGCRVLMDEGRSLADVAARCGFHDQAHMTHEWTRLAGTTPAAWIAQQLPFLQDYEVSAGDDERTSTHSRR